MNLTKPAPKMLVECNYAFCDVADKLACSEANTIAALYRAAGMLGNAATFAQAHAEGDDDEEDEYRIERPAFIDDSRNTWTYKPPHP